MVPSVSDWLLGWSVSQSTDLLELTGGSQSSTSHLQDKGRREQGRERDTRTHTHTQYT